MTMRNPSPFPQLCSARLGAPSGSFESYLAPKPPEKGRVVGLDCHPDTFTAAVFVGTTPHDARKLACRADLSLDAFLEWARREFTREDLFLMEAGSNSFEIHRRLLAMGLRAVVLESAYVGKHAKNYVDNDKMAAARIALVYFAGNAPCVWVPDATTRERRELLHLYNNAVTAHTASVNSLKGYLNQFTIRTGKRGLSQPKTREWILRQREWTPLQSEILNEEFATLDQQAARRKRCLQLIAREISTEPLMLRCMKVLGIGLVNAFALMAAIGEIGRFDNPAKLVAYAGLNPGRRESGRSKSIKVGVGKRGRCDIRHLLMQGAHAVLRMGRDTALGKWGWKLFARKGHRNVAVAAVARKLLVQVWHVLSGNPPEVMEPNKSLNLKLKRLTVVLGKKLRAELGLPKTIDDCVIHFQTLLTERKIDYA